MNPTENKEIRQVALLIAFATGLQLAENSFPQPLPGLKLGLANMITLLALVKLGFRTALEIALLRTLIASLVWGTFLSSGFLLSFVGALASTLVMGLLYRLAAPAGLSLVGISVAGAVAHCLAQIALVFLLLIRHPGVFVLLPWLIIGAVATGWITGLVTAQVCRKLHAAPDPAGYRNQVFGAFGERALPVRFFGRAASPKPPQQTLAPLIKIIVVLVLAVVILLAKNLWSFATLFAFLVALTSLAGVPARRLLRTFRGLIPLLLFSFIIPCCFIHTGAPLFHMGPVIITRDAFIASGVSASRILLLMLSAASLITPAPGELVAGLRACLSPLKYCGVRTERTAAIIAYSLSALPIVWEQSRRTIKAQNLRSKGIREWLPALAVVMATLYSTTLASGADAKGRLP
ncbi:MAG: Gx transporter family protein [Verrucomicrobia bacterium]|nr:MAG: Gx transporter family protein [Verrucomicrobiota bacterium]